ncbi:PKD domain-containing protein, partial [Lutibacter sp. B1]|uniref:PKD domain-containing protein n=1 Tax=Lutibacter sp. B1 TaxID=2725996 RepID=UPI0014573DBA
MKKNYLINQSLKSFLVSKGGFNKISNYFSLITFITLFLISSSAFSQTASFNFVTNQTCSPVTASFTDTSVGATSWEWNLGNSNTSTVKNPSANYSQPGTYTVTLTINGGGSAELVSTQTISVYPSPYPSLPLTLTGCEPFTTTLTAEATPVVVESFDISGTPVGGITGGDISSYTFDFLGVLPTVTQASPTLNLTDLEEGTYDVLLTVEDVNECSETIFKQGAIIVYPKPTADFTFVKESICGLGEVTFYGNTTISSGSVVDYSWEIDGVEVSTAQNFTHNFTAAGDYDVTFTAISNDLCSSDPVTKQISFNVGSATDFSFVGECAGVPVEFTDDSSADAVSWEWDFQDDGTIDSTNQSPNFTYDSPGNYTAKLTTTFSDGCIISTTKDVLISGATATFTYATTSACSPDYTINFTDTSTVSGTTIDTYAWDFGGGNTSSLKDPAFNFNGSGSFPVTLTVTTVNGCTNTITTDVDIPETAVDFESISLEGCVSVPREFSVIYTNSSDPILTYAWTFGDGGTSTNANPTYTYSAAGEYDVSLTVTTTNGCTLTNSKTDYIEVGEEQSITFTSDKIEYCIDESIQLTAAITNLTDQIEWDFGDGNVIMTDVDSVTESTTSHTYDATGTYTISATAIYNGCESDVYELNVLILQPQAIFTASSYSECIAPSSEITFTNNSVVDNITPIYLWDFGDGTTSTDENPTHSYNVEGDYAVTLTVTDSGTAACEDTITANIYVTTFTPVFIISDTSPICAGSSLDFTHQLALPENASSNFSAASYAWDFGDGNTSTDENPTHTYDTPGLYTATLTVIEEHGCEEIYTYPTNIVVNGPIVDFSSAPSPVCAGGIVTFTSSVTQRSGSPVDPATTFHYAWDFGDGNTSTDVNPTHSYSSGADYTVTLTVTDDQGCSSTKISSANVRVPVLTAGLTTTKNIYCVDTDITFTSTSTVSFGTIDFYEWDLDGDGIYETSGNDTSQILNFDIIGDKTVNLRVTNDIGCEDIISKTISVVDDYVDIVIADTNLGCAPAQAQFSTTDPTGVVASYFWDFGDGYTSTLQNPSHFYALPGDYTATLTETLTGGCIKSSTVEIFVDGPRGDFQFDTTPGCAPHDVTFKVDNLFGVDGLVWDFGDGNTVSETIASGVTSSTITHTYTTYGSRLPIIILNSPACGSYSYVYGDNLRTNTTEKPIPNFSFTSVSGESCESSSIQFTDESEKVDPRYPISVWNWDFGDGNTSNLQNPIHIYTASGTYTITLTVGNGLVSGCDATISQDITVNALPDAVATPTAQYICSTDSNVDIVLTSSLANTTFDWTRTSPSGITTTQPTSGTDVAIGGSIPRSTFTNTTNAPITITYTITPIGPSPTYCIGDDITATVTVNPTPTISSAATKTICDSTDLDYDITSATTGTTFTWTVSETT